MKRFLLIIAILAPVFLVAALLLTPRADSGVVIIGGGGGDSLIDDEFIFGLTGVAGVEKTQRVIPDEGILLGVSSSLSRINAPSGYTGDGTLLRDVGVATAGGASTITLATAESYANNALNGYTIYILQGTGAHQSRTISSSSGDVFTVSSGWTTQPASGSVYQITGGTAASGDDAYVTTADYTVNGTTAGRVQDIEVNVGHALGTSNATLYNYDTRSAVGAVNIKSEDAQLLNARVIAVHGLAVMVTYDATGQTTYAPHNRMLTRDSDIMRCHIGWQPNVPDSWIEGCMVETYRDYGMYVPAGITACHSNRNHIYGSGPYGIAQYVDGGEFTSTQDKLDDSWVALWVGGNGYNSQWSNLFTQKCWYRNLMLLTKCAVNGARISTFTSSAQWPDIVGVEIRADGVMLSGVQHDINWLTGSGHTSPVACGAAVRIASGVDFVTLDNYRIVAEDNTYTGEIGVHIDGPTYGTKLDITSIYFDNTNDCCVKVDENTIKGCDITIREALHTNGDGSSQNLIDIPAGWDDTNRITLIQSDGSITIYDAEHMNDGTAL